MLRINLLLLLVVSLLPFPTRLVADGLDDVSGERVFVTLYGFNLLGIRIFLTALDAHARREHLTSDGREPEAPGKSLLPVVVGYSTAILIGLVLPAVAVGLYCVIAVYLVVPLGPLARLVFPRS